MSAEFLVPLLALVTLGVVVILAMRSQHRADQRRKDSSVPKSSLAKDGDPHRAVG